MFVIPAKTSSVVARHFVSDRNQFRRNTRGDKNKETKNEIGSSNTVFPSRRKMVGIKVHAFQTVIATKPQKTTMFSNTLLLSCLPTVFTHAGEN